MSYGQTSQDTEVCDEGVGMKDVEYTEKGFLCYVCLQDEWKFIKANLWECECGARSCLPEKDSE